MTRFRNLRKGFLSDTRHSRVDLKFPDSPECLHSKGSIGVADNVEAK